MYDNTALIRHTIAHSYHGKLETVGQARRWGVQLYWHQRLRASLAQLRVLVNGRCRHLRNLDEIADTSISGRRELGIRTVPLNQIIGSEGRTHDFDADFRPLCSHNMDRWVGIAAAQALGAILPPVELIQVGSAYFVRDGNHRISVANALGQIEIDAHVTLWQTHNS